MSSYQSFVTTRQTEPDRAALISAVRAAVGPLAGVSADGDGSYRVKTPDPLTAPQITAAQQAIDTAPAASAQLTAQAEIDVLGIREKAILLALLDQLNVIRGKLAPPLGAITPAQAIAAARTKAGSL